MEKFDVTCRTCNTERSNLINLSSKVLGNDALSLSDVLLTVCPEVSIQDNDRLPQNICYVCSEQLQIAYKFQLQCKKAHNELLDILEPTTSELIQPLFHRKNEETHDDNQDKLCIKEDYEESSTALNEELEILEDDDDIESDDEELTEEIPEAEEILQNPVEYNYPLSNENEAPIMCCHCDKRFFTLTGLRFHEKLTHKNLKPILTDAEILTIECKYCLQVFERQTELTLHCRNEHRNELAKDLTCNICQKIFSGKNRYEHHLLYHAKSRYQCTVKNCLRTFVIKYKLTDHLKRFHGITLSPSQMRAIKPRISNHN